MKFLGIDYGTKRVGIALSDDEGRLAFPKIILENDVNLLDKIGEILHTEKVAKIVFGESLNFKGEKNIIWKEAEEFSKKVEQQFGLPIYKEKEFLTSVEARRHLENSGGQARRSAELGKKIDASAAALILQRYLDKNNKK